MKSTTIIRIHATILILCSLTGFFGFYFHNHFFQPTAVIPAVVGINMLLLSGVLCNNPKVRRALGLLVIIVFGIIVTRMAIEFVSQSFQPLRKRIYFPVMALSSIITIVIITWNTYSNKH